ncbi:MAG TPA: hypothetical protein VED41_12540 [Solirubrobacteraceae bacterium]|nr:hypothetical protein [Solirubrobacteraceae bacterium]
MTQTLEAAPSIVPDAGVIEEARDRQRRHRLAATALSILTGAVIVGVAWGIAGGVGGPRSGSVHARPRATPLTGSQRQTRTSCQPIFGHALQGAPGRSLLSILGVLRRPATSADELPLPAHYSGDAFVRYVRRARVVGSESFYVYPALLGCRPGRVGLMEATTHVELGRGLIGGGGGGGADAADIKAGEDVSTGPPGSSTSATITMIVPDGVASVTLRYPAGRASGYSPKVSPPFTVTTAPVGNVVVVRVPRSAGGGPIWQPTMIWRNARGQVIQTFRKL